MSGRKILNRKNTPMSIIVGCVLSVGVSLVGTLGIALLLENDVLQETGIKNAVMLLSALSVFVGSLIATRMAGKRVLPIALGTGAAYMTVMLCCTALFFEGQYSNIWARLLVIAAGTGCALIVKLKKKPSVTPHKKYRIR